jgi:hypothetical protein
LTYRFNVTPIKVPHGLLAEINKLIVKVKGLRAIKMTVKKNSRV